MPISAILSPRSFRDTAAALVCLAALAGCSNNQTPAPAPAKVEILSGDAQYTRKGTQLEDPVVFRVKLEDGKAAAGVGVQFSVIEGGGSVSPKTAVTSQGGHTSTYWTVGPDTGPNRIRATVVDHPELSVIASATSSEYWCPEEEPVFTPTFGPVHGLMLLTSYSSSTPAGAGLLDFAVDTQKLTFDGNLLGDYPNGGFQYTVKDCVFSARGDLFISWNHVHDEIVKVATDGTVSHFATLDSNIGAEIDMTPSGVLVGCDPMGPFYATCRDTLYRFDDAVFSGDNTTRDEANNDAMACDPVTGDVYFIYKFDRQLYRISFDGSIAGSKQAVVQLPLDESDGAKGMVVDGTDQSIYILVQSAGTKSIVKVTHAGVKSTEFDFTTRGPGDAAGIQSDLTLDRTYRWLYTLDTLNNKILLYELSIHQVHDMEPPASLPYLASNESSGERVGLAVIPAP
ncbi:MAG TPA: hypothetical protein VFH88_05710 [Candidatus Krumholzibacteria bacterium]|nr:hypothetical protein [Candidatus Krumholzibacteria bacterium]